MVGEKSATPNFNVIGNFCIGQPHSAEQVRKKQQQRVQIDRPNCQQAEPRLLNVWYYLDS